MHVIGVCIQSIRPRPCTRRRHERIRVIILNMKDNNIKNNRIGHNGIPRDATSSQVNEVKWTMMRRPALSLPFSRQHGHVAAERARDGHREETADLV